MVRAMAGDRPETIASQPIRRVALVILMSWLATAVSTVATPLMSRTKTLARISEIMVRDLFMMSEVRMESSTPTRGSSRMPSQMGVTGVDISWTARSSSLRMRSASRASARAISRASLWATLAVMS